MLKRNWWYVLLIVLVLCGIGLLWHSRSGNSPEPQQGQLADGSPALLANPAGSPDTRVLLVLPREQWLSANELQDLAGHSDVRLLQIALAPGDCDLQQRRLQAAKRFLDGEPELVAGVDAGAALAWRWLATQNNDKAQALSIGFNLNLADCPAPLPSEAAHGRWHVAWNDNPDDASARFVRRQPNADTGIGAYDASLAQLLREQLEALLSGQGEAMPIVEVPASHNAATVTLFYSGDGGWRDLDRDVAQEMAKRGFAVVGIDALRYFWQHKSPQQGAADLSQLMRVYRQKWGAKRFVLAGYSFGADVLPAFYNQLPPADQQQVDAIFLLALARSGSFEIEVQGWLGKAGTEAPTGPELLKLPAAKVLCIYGSDEADESGCTLPHAPGEILRLPGGHHYDENYPALAARLVQAIHQRQGSVSDN